jgi:hypothetical protein
MLGPVPVLALVPVLDLALLLPQRLDFGFDCPLVLLFESDLFLT